MRNCPADYGTDEQRRTAGAPVSHLIDSARHELEATRSANCDSGLRGLWAGIGASAVALALLCGVHDPLLAAGIEQLPPGAVCDSRLKPAVISVEPQPLRFTVDNSQDMRTLTALEHKAPNQRVLGRTVSKFKAESKTSLSNIKLANGRYCVSLSITVQLSLDPATVYVASEYRTGSCEARLILEHERRHLAVSERQLAQLARYIHDDLVGMFGERMLITDDVAPALSMISQRSRDAISARVASVSKESKALQAEVDSSEEISRLSDLRRVCAGAAK
jgi:hypothetical protein